ncbi:MAG: hypothetical protein AB7E46_11625 [Desulfovibrio sp.]|jgi:hypothetical protein
MLKARGVFGDFQRVCGMLKEESGKQEYRILWVAALTLCRAVGHVLDKVDGKASSEAKKIINDMFAGWKNGDENKIFREFIEKERNLVLKQYEIGYDDGPLDIHSCDNVYDIVDVHGCAMAKGEYFGSQSSDILQQAIVWWETQLDEIERRIEGN